MLFLLLATVLAVAQNVIGVIIAIPMGMHPLFGVLNGSVTLTGGPATGLAFAPAFEAAGVPGAATVAIAAAMVGIVSGGLIGGPVGTILIERYTSAGRNERSTTIRRSRRRSSRIRSANRAASTPPGEDKESYTLLKALVVILVAMWAGSGVSALDHVGRHHAAGLHRCDAGGGGHPQRRTMRRA